MTKSNRLGAVMAAASLVAIVTACAGPGSSGPRSASIFGSKADTANIGLATKAQLALASNDLATALPLAERAVEHSPKDAGFRALLGNCYLAAGRFASAEAAYRDSLSLVSTQPQIILKLALVQIAQGKGEEAKNLLATAQSLLDPADIGLALALAGDPHSAIALLDPAARAIGADARTRQNLALAHAFAGNWDQARTIAAQDVAPEQLDGRIQQWMALAKPARSSDQVASFIGVQPVAGDPGQPQRLALVKNDNIRQAAAAPVAVEATPEMAYAAGPAVAEAAPTPVVAEVAAAPEPLPALPPVIFAAVSAPAVDATPVSPIRDARPALSPSAVRLSDTVASLRRAASSKARTGRSRAVVQLGAFSSRDRVALAWNKAIGKFGSLKEYTPVSARFDGANGAVYRLSVKGFASDREAIDLCASLKRAGRACFVRAASGDSPVGFASR